MKQLSSYLFLFLFLLGSGDALAATASDAGELPLDPNSWQANWTAGALMLFLLFAAFFAMTRYEVPLPLAMSLVSCSFLIIQWESAQEILRRGFSHYADITILFTAVAIPAHMIERSQGFKWVAAWLGHQLGKVRLRHPRITMPLLVTILLLATYITAGLMHNVTSILIMTPIIIRLCASYQIPSRWILSAALVASNLGGFSTRWGDTPNIIESAAWGLQASDFMREVLPANLLVVAALIIVATVLTQRGITTKAAAAVKVPFYTLQVAQTAADWKKAKSDLAIDTRLLSVGLALLAFFILLHVIFPPLAITIGAATIVIAVLLERKSERYHSLTSLGFDVYLAFAAIFVLAGCVSHSWIGASLYQQLIAAKAAPWVIAVTGYFGTTFTEAASWATAVSHSIQQLDPSHAAAWALGGGICAGSSSLVTAASAGIILAEESQRFNDPEHAITFRRYLAFGLPFSLFMLIFYATYFSIFR
ncbi:MAG TPA: SLC13 family permease [Chthoniobacterales bacterium]|jgi:Na+/H+ antiporter NhaD/arsenite permease-like protein|nr:SLC13 family permease [Chthoniobacterales bacterium]